MPTIDHPSGLRLEQLHAFAEKVASHVAFIVNAVRTGGTSPTGHRVEGESIGVGSACMWGVKKFILTAKHVVEGANARDLRFFFRHAGKVDWDERRSRQSFAVAVPVGIEEILRFQAEDLACIVLSAQAHEMVEFVPLPAGLGKVPPAGEGTILYGSPVDQNIPVAALRNNSELRVAFATQPRGCWAVVKGEIPPSFPSSFDPDRHFLLEYDPSEEGAMPHGFSGAGIWYQDAGSGPIWSARPILAGVQTQWHRPSNTMIAIRAERVLELLKSKFDK